MSEVAQERAINAAIRGSGMERVKSVEAGAGVLQIQMGDEVGLDSEANS